MYIFYLSLFQSEMIEDYPLFLPAIETRLMIHPNILKSAKDRFALLWNERKYLLLT